MSWKGHAAGILGLLALLLPGPAPAQGVRAGDWLVRGGATGVFPTHQPESDRVVLLDGTNTGTQTRVENGYGVGLTLAYMLTDHWAIELLGALPYFEHSIKVDGGALEALGLDEIAEIKMLPPSLNGQYHFNAGGPWKPYVGAGVTFFWVLDESNEMPGALGGIDIDVDDAWGVNGQVGVDYLFSNGWLVNADLRYVWLETEAKLGGLTRTIEDVELNPIVFSLQVGYRF